MEMYCICESFCIGVYVTIYSGIKNKYLNEVCNCIHIMMELP